MIPFGANFTHLPDRETALSRTRGRVCRLLFVGVDWTRKRGAIALAAYERLKAMGIPVEMSICGCTPPAPIRDPGVRVYQFLDKSKPEEARTLADIYANADFFVLPTRKEAYGIVFCDAAAFGVPVIATDTGGVCEIVREGETGHLLPPDADGGAYATLIAEIYRDPARHERLMSQSREAYYDSRLNWDAWGAAATRLLEEMVGDRQAVRRSA